MKWLATTSILCLLATPLAAQSQDIVRLPTALFCGPIDPDHDKKLLEEYGEIPFVEGDGEILSPDPTMSYHGVVKFYLDPNDNSYSIFLEINDEITCLITTGEKIQPVVSGSSI
jgi:hypothetical protein